MAVALEVDPPELVRHELALVGVERRVGVEVDHGRRAPVGGREHRRVDGDLALLEVPVRPHRTVADDVARGRVDVDRLRQPEHRPEALRPGAGRDHDLLPELDRALARSRPRAIEPSAPLSKPVTSTPESTGRPPPRTSRRGLDGVHVEREPALALVQADRDALRAPVGEEGLHVGVDLGLADEELGAVADPLLALEGGGEVVLLARGAEGDVADRVVARRRRGRTPTPRRTPASARSSRAGSSCSGRRRRRCPTRPRRGRLVEDDDVRARTPGRVREAPSRGGRRSRGRGCLLRRRRTRRVPGELTSIASYRNGIPPYGWERTPRAARVVNRRTTDAGA